MKALVSENRQVYAEKVVNLNTCENCNNQIVTSEISDDRTNWIYIGSVGIQEWCESKKSWPTKVPYGYWCSVDCLLQSIYKAFNLPSCKKKK